MPIGSSPRRLSTLIACLCLIALLAAIWPIYRAFLNIEIDGNEGWNAYHADAAMGRMPLYPARELLITNNYPPGSFYIVGAAGRMIGDAVLAGRLLSLLSVAGIAGGVAFVTQRLTGNRAAAGIGAAYFVATMCVAFSGYVGMNDPHLLAQAVMTLGFAAFLRAMERDRGYWAPILLMVAAGFIKHNIIVMPLTAMVWLGMHKPWQFVKCGVLAGCAVGAGFAVCFAVFGPDFLANLMSPRAILWRQSFGAVGHLQWVAVGLAVWLYVGIVRRADPGVRLCSLLILLGLVNFFAQKTGMGVDHNALFELVFGVSVAVGLAFAQAPLLPVAQRFSPDLLRFIVLLGICLRLIVPAQLDAVRFLADPGFSAEIAAREAAMSATVARIKMTPGDVDCSLLACYRAGKPFALDPFNAGQRITAGRLPADAVSQCVESGKLTVVRADPLLSWNGDR